MPRPRSPKRDEAYQIYAKHNGNIENRRIAEQLDIDERFISKWKHEDTWVDKLKKNKSVHHSLNAVHQKDERCTPNPAENIPTKDIPKNPPGETAAQPPLECKSKTNTKKRGGQLGNQNAKDNAGGPGGPLGNKKAVTTGEFESIIYADLTDEEKAIYNAPIDEIVEMERHIRIERIRIQRANKRVMAAENAPGGMVIESVNKIKGAPSNDRTQTIAVASVDRADKFEKSLTRVLAGTRQSIALYHKMKQRDKAESGNGGQDDTPTSIIIRVRSDDN